MKVALVHEFLNQFGGAEQILKAFHEMYPQAPIYVLAKDEKVVKEYFPKADIRVSWIQKLPGWYKQYLVLMPKAIESFDFSQYDLVISDSSAFAKGVITKKPTVHICYLHTPTRYLWGETDYYVKTVVPASIRPFLAISLSYLRKWDYQAARRPNVLIANSKEVQTRIKKYYDRQSIVVHPFVGDRFFENRKLKTENFYLMGGRLVPYKRYDIVIEAFKKNGKPLKIVGSGYGEAKLKKLAPKAPNIKFTGRVSDRELIKLYRQAKAYIFPALEDFGIVTLEAQACGTPVICYGKGGSLETVIEDKTGFYFDKQTPDSVNAAINRFEQFGHFEKSALRKHALQFSKKRFILNVGKIINEEIWN